MKKNRIIAFLLALLILPVYSVPAEAAYDITFFPTDDSYVISGSRWEHKNYGNAETMLFGTAYNRVAIMKFDLSNIDLSSYNGALLTITLSAVSADSSVEVYTTSDDWTEKKVTFANFPGDYNYVINTGMEKKGRQKISLSINNALKYVKDNNLKTMSIALKSNGRCMSVFSSEASNASLRPTLTLTEKSAYIRGQMDFKFPQVTQNELKAEMTKTISKGHPYLFANKENIQKIKDYAFGKDEFLTKQYQSTKKKADELLESDIKRITVDASKASYIGNAIDSWNNTMTLALIYLVEGDERYAQKAYEQSKYFCELDNWGTYQMIDNVQTVFCVALCYDWLNDWLNAEQKDVLVNGLRKLHLNMASDVFKNPTKEEYKWSFHQAFFGKDNHAIMDCSLTFLAAMSIADTDVDFATNLMQRTLNQINRPFSVWYPDSSWYEGVGYWGYAGPYTARLLLAMKNAFGHCFGYEEIECLLNVADHPIYAKSPQGPLILDNIYLTGSTNSDPILYSMGVLKGDVSLQAYAIERSNVINRADAIFTLMYDVNADYGSSLSLKLDKHFRNDEVITMRNTHNGTQPVFCAMSANGYPVTTGMMDCGSVALDALGERWIMNHGKENYYSGYWGDDHFKYYRTRAESQSCVVIDPSEYGGQDIMAYSKFDLFESNDNSSYAIADITPCYASQAISYKRGIQLVNNRRFLIVQDEMILKKPSEVYSFFNMYQAKIEILEDGRSAIVTKNNKKLYVTVDCDKEFTLSAMYAEPLPTSPIPPNPNSPNREFMKLAIHFDNVDSVNVRVCFTPYLCEEELSAITHQSFVPMSEWSLSTDSKITPVVEDIKIKGASIASFDSADRCYDTDEEIEVSDVDVVYDSSKYKLNVLKDDKNGAVNILVTYKNDPSNMNSYSIAIPEARVPNYMDISGMNQLVITDTQAPEPQKENNIANMYDNDLSTRWSASGAGTVMKLTLDKEREVACIAMNHYEGSKDRIQYFDVEVSTDGMSWTKVGRFDSSGVTDDTEYYDLKKSKAKYVKVIYDGCNTSSWNSVLELRLYGK